MKLSKLGSSSFSLQRATAHAAAAAAENGGGGGDGMDEMYELNYYTALPAVPGLTKPAQKQLQQLQQQRRQSSPGGTSAPSPQFRSSALQSTHRRKTVGYERPHTRSELAEIDASLAALADALAAYQLSSESDWGQHLAKLAEFSSRCDDMSTHVCDIMSVVSTEAGRCAYKLRHTYQACFQHFQNATNELVDQLHDCQDQLQQTTSEKEALVAQLSEQEHALRAEADARVAQVLAEAVKERKLRAEEHGNVREYVDEVNGTLKSLNVIFKTMQGNMDAVHSIDAHSQLKKLEQRVRQQDAELFQLRNVNAQLDKTTSELEKSQERLAAVEAELAQTRLELSRKQASLHDLMEKEAQRLAEIEALKAAAMQAEDEQGLKEDDESLDDESAAPATVLCIRCRRALDDIANIREALGHADPSQRNRVQCDAFRVLIPNLDGYRPHRSSAWVRACIRAMLWTRSQQEGPASWHMWQSGIRMPHYVYEWFEPREQGGGGGSGGGGAGSQIVQRAPDEPTKCSLADEDRWGFYYGCKALARDTAEGKLFFLMLDETAGEDANTFILYCLRVYCSIDLDVYDQLGLDAPRMQNVADLPRDIQLGRREVPQHVLISAESAKRATRVVLAKALKPQLEEALETVAALVLPNTNKLDLFLWVRAMLQKYQSEQQHRKAAIKLMFDTAASGALVAKSAHIKSKAVKLAPGFVDFPQFHAILATLWPGVPLAESTKLFIEAQRDQPVFGKGVSADTFFRVADRWQFFSKAIIPVNAVPLPSPPRGKLESRTRIQLGTLVHAAVSKAIPVFENMQATSNALWAPVFVSVLSVLRDAYDKLPSLQDAFTVDGLHLYITYRRILAIIILHESLVEHHELQRAFASPRAPEVLKMLSRELRALEVVALKNRTHASERFEQARIVLCSRRIGVLWRQRVLRSSPVPLSVRQLFRRGYILNHTDGIKTRHVYYEPWWTHAVIADIFQHKLSADVRAAAEMQSPVALSEAVVACMLKKYGEPEVAERMTHDLFFNVMALLQAVPRVHLFACFLGITHSLSDAHAFKERVQQQRRLASAEALNEYLNALVAIRHATHTAGLDASDAGTLFPSTELPWGATAGSPQLDHWRAPTDVVFEALQPRWECTLQRFPPASTIIDRLRRTILRIQDATEQTVDVDEVLFLHMYAWAEIAEAACAEASKVPPMPHITTDSVHNLLRKVLMGTNKSSSEELVLRVLRDAKVRAVELHDSATPIISQQGSSATVPPSIERAISRSLFLTDLTGHLQRLDQLQLRHGCCSVLLMHQLLLCWQRYRSAIEDARRTAGMDASTVAANVTTGSVRAERIASELQATISELPGLMHRQRLDVEQAAHTAKSQQLLATLFSVVGELQHNRKVEFPRDAWESGRKPSIESNVYRIGKRN